MGSLPPRPQICKILRFLDPARDNIYYANNAVRRSRGSVISWYSSHASGSWTNFDEICRQQKIRTNIGQSSAEILKFFKFKMADGRHVGKYWKCHNSPTNGPIETKLEWSHPIMSPTCPPWCGCHGNGCCLATVHSTFSSCGRLEVERMNQFQLRNQRAGGGELPP